MALDRVEALRSMLAQDPNNSFARYGLAMELVNRGELEAAIGAFDALLAATPDYTAAYFHRGQTLEKMGRLDDARTTYREGVEAATRKGDMHTRSELQTALDLLGE